MEVEQKHVSNSRAQKFPGDLVKNVGSGWAGLGWGQFCLSKQCGWACLGAAHPEKRDRERSQCKGRERNRSNCLAANTAPNRA